jgi:deoxyribodipyrimidine photolyase-like uncharacterized protein
MSRRQRSHRIGPLANEDPFALGSVLGMGAFAVYDLMTTNPHVAGSAYLDRMGDY